MLAHSVFAHHTTVSRVNFVVRLFCDLVVGLSQIRGFCVDRHNFFGCRVFVSALWMRRVEPVLFGMAGQTTIGIHHSHSVVHPGGHHVMVTSGMIVVKIQEPEFRNNTDGDGGHNDAEAS